MSALQEREKKERILWLDACKGFAILLVVLGHIADSYLRTGLFLEKSIFLQTMYEFIYAFHMPLFFALSGYVFYEVYLVYREIRQERFQKQCANIIWNYFIFSLLQWIMKRFFIADVNMPFTIRDLMLLFIKPMGLYWYLYVLLFLYFICWKLNLPNGDRKRDTKVFIGIIFISLGSTVFFNMTNLNIVFPIRNILYYIVFFYLGNYLAAYTDTPLLKSKSTEKIGGVWRMARYSCYKQYTNSGFKQAGLF